VHAAIVESVAAGTAVVGDITNTLVTSDPLVRSPLAAMVFYELLKSLTDDPKRFVDDALDALGQAAHSDRVRASLAAHAPYSVAPSVFKAMRAAMSRLEPPCSVHLAESAEEVEFIRTGGGPWRALKTELGAMDPAWTAPGCTPVEFLDRMEFIGPTVVAVHGVQMTDSDLRLLAARRATLVTCPRSNIHTGAGEPPIQRFYDSGVRVAVGTDSLASVEDLNVFSELAAMRRIAPHVAASKLIDSATRQGAKALGFGADYGTIEAGKRARLVAVDVPPSCGDVEEYLVGGIDPRQIHWLHA
jgi:cytosine/adenosine deaminase-related metal-dependent hydrolase